MGTIIVTLSGKVSDIVTNYQAILLRLQALQSVFPNATVIISASFINQTFTNFQAIQVGTINGVVITASFSDSA